MRWYLLSSPVLRGSDVVIEEKGLAEPIRLVCNPIWNTWYFLSMYANADGLRGRVRTDQTGVLDRYILAKTRRLVEDVTASMTTYDLAGATGHISLFLDALTNWYVRRSRDRFWRPVNAGTSPGTAAVPGALPTTSRTPTTRFTPFSRFSAGSRRRSSPSSARRSIGLDRGTERSSEDLA